MGSLSARATMIPDIGQQAGLADTLVSVGEALAERAAACLDDLHQRDPARRPLFIEFAGTPKSGKSSCIDSVVHFFRRMNYVVLAPSEGASRRTPYYLRNDLIAFNTWSASYALTQIMEGLYHSDRYDVVVLDRGLFD